MRLGVLALAHVYLAAALAEAPTAGFRFRDLEKLIQDVKATTVEAVLQELPDRLLSNFTFVRHSESSQGASDENPRTILFGDDGRLLIAFNGDENQGGYRKLEVIEATDDGPLEFHEITFAVNGIDAPKVSDPNPKNCLKCHGDRSGYRWAGYSRWDGLYGEADDQMSDKSAFVEKFDAFLRKVPEHPRYSALIFAGGKRNRRYPYYADSKYRNMDRMPNTRLSKAILRNEARARIALVKSQAWYKKARAGWAFKALQCDENALGEAGKRGLAISLPHGRTAAREAAMANTAMHPDYQPPQSDGVSSWEEVLDSAVLAEASTQWVGVKKAYEDTRTLLADFYEANSLSGTNFRPAALDQMLVVFRPIYRFDEDNYEDFLDYVPEVLSNGVKRRIENDLEARIKLREKQIVPGCKALEAQLEDLSST